MYYYKENIALNVCELWQMVTHSLEKFRFPGWCLRECPSNRSLTVSILSFQDRLQTKKKLALHSEAKDRNSHVKRK